MSSLSRRPPDMRLEPTRRMLCDFPRLESPSRRNRALKGLQGLQAAPGPRAPSQGAETRGAFLPNFTPRGSGAAR